MMLAMCKSHAEIRKNEMPVEMSSPVCHIIPVKVCTVFSSSFTKLKYVVTGM